MPKRGSGKRECSKSRAGNKKNESKLKAALIGAFMDSGGQLKLTESGEKINKASGGGIEKQINVLGPVRKGKSRVFYEATSDYPVVVVVGLGSSEAGYNPMEEIDEKNENVRAAVAMGCRVLRDLGGIGEIDVDGCENPQAAAEGAHLGLFYYDFLKSERFKKPVVKVNFLTLGTDKGAQESWEMGRIHSEAQNLARILMETPANLMTPTIFAETASEKLTKVGVQCTVRDKAWAESQKMFSFLSVAKGSEEPPTFLEMHYNGGGGGKPILFVGKGITFDSGGISIKKAQGMEWMRADCGGAANVAGAIYGLAAKKAKVNVIGLAPLTENLPSGTANKPGDVVTAMNGKTIQIDNTDAEGRLILADALCYAHTFDPLLILDIATLTGAMSVAMGSGVAGVFTTSPKYYEILHKAGIATGDRVWRFPIWNHWVRQTVDSQLADCLNVGKVPGGGCCIAAAFLKEFVTTPNWLHVDIAGLMKNADEVPYLCKGCPGRPCRTLIKFAEDVFAKGGGGENETEAKSFKCSKKDANKESKVQMKQASQNVELNNQMSKDQMAPSNDPNQSEKNKDQPKEPSGQPSKDQQKEPSGQPNKDQGGQQQKEQQPTGPIWISPAGKGGQRQ